ncbi:MAG: pyridoxal-phosphate dependent enzyme [Cyclobacteriaceae bacterium]
MNTKNHLFPSADVINAAAKRIAPFIHHTPVLTCATINKLLGAQLFFKCENFQKVGAFKFRGACNAVFSIDDTEIKNGIATHSSGNHAQAIALAASMRNTKAYIVMPYTAPKVKREAVIGYGAEVISCEPSLRSREKTLEAVVARTGANIIHPYNDYCVIAGQATCAKELIEEIGEPDYLVSPVGGGGLLGGTALSAAWFTNNTKVIGAEPSGADDAKRSLLAGVIIPSENPKTIADGLLSSLGDKTFPIIQNYVDDILTADDESIIYWMKMVWQRMKIIIEPSCAVVLAAIASHPDKFANRRLGVILTGGNVDLENLPF